MADLGMTDIGTIETNTLLLSMTHRTVDIIIEAGQGELSRGTLLEKKGSKYIIWAGSNAQAGTLGTNVDATDEDVNAFMIVDADVNIAALFAGVTLTDAHLGLNTDSLLNIKEAY